MCETIKPLHDMVVITDEKPQQTSCIEVVDSRPSNQAEVIATGPGRILKNGRRAPMQVKPGDRVLVGRYAGYRYELASGTVRMVDVNEIMAIL